MISVTSAKTVGSSGTYAASSVIEEDKSLKSTTFLASTANLYVTPGVNPVMISDLSMTPLEKMTKSYPTSL